MNYTYKLRIFKLKNVNLYAADLLALMLNKSIILGIYEIFCKYNLMGFGYLQKPSGIIINLIIIAITLLFIFLTRDFKVPVLLMLIYLIMLTYSLLVYPQIEIMLARAVVYFIVNIFCIIVLMNKIDDFQYLLNKLKCYIPFALLYSLLELFFWEGDKSYELGYTYHIAIPTIICLISIYQKKRINFWYLINFLIFCVTIFKCGTRSGILYIIIAMLLMFYFNNLKSKILLIGPIMLLVSLIFYYRNILIRVFLILFSGTRNAALIASGRIFYSSGRLNYYMSLISEILRNPWSIRGVYSDRIYLCERASLQGLESLWGNYAHNIYIEILFQLGIISIPILVYGTMKIISTIKKSKIDIYSQKLCTIFISIAVAQLMVSSSYLISETFGCLVGVIMMVNKRYSLKRKCEKNISTEFQSTLK